MKNIYTFIALLLVCKIAFSAKVDTIEVFSAKMQKNIKTVVIQPSGKTQDKYPTVYLLHGYGGQYSDYVNRVPKVKEMVDLYGFIAVCPDGGHSSWYWDLAGEQDFQYETFVARELPQYINTHYPVYDDAKKRAITGFSMGGHGALYLTLRNQDVFGVVGSTAGGVDIRPFPNNWNIAKRLGDYAQHADTWKQHTVLEMLHLAKSDLSIFIDCGRDDFFYGVNKELHDRLLYLNVPHHYHIMPGKHDWQYVNNSIAYQVAFFFDVFTLTSND